ncbi:MAG TPA: DUF1269 domain-containing protein [Rhodocyclaceae bacterium]|nr:DUF1269 domain-containing protein [Rhodocyclaceae bacterium]
MDIMTGDPRASRRLLIAEFTRAKAAEAALGALNDKDFPLDKVSILGGGHSSGDDPLGIYYVGVGERMKGWGAMGALWGGLFGLVTGAAGLFIVPGLGAVMAAGPVVEALASAAAGATVGGGAMAGAAAVTQLATALRRMGIPDEELERLEGAIREGRTLLLLHVGADEAAAWRDLLERHEPAALHAFAER